MMMLVWVLVVFNFWVSVQCQGIVRQRPYLINNKDCWGKCNNKGGSCPAICGVDGYCCRKGYMDCIKIYRDVATSDYHKCVRGNPPVNGIWGAWSPWSTCSFTCGGGIQQRNRSCNYPDPTGGGLQCLTSQGKRNREEELTESCNNQQCIIQEIKMGKTKWGSFKEKILCQLGKRVVGFRLRVQPKQPEEVDDTALNGIQLACSDGKVTNEIQGNTGTWKKWVYCGGKRNSSMFVVGFNFRSEPVQGRGDDTAGNDVKVKCNDGTELNGGGLDGGTWEDKYRHCYIDFHLCGVQTMIEPQIKGDNTGLNQIKFLCCKPGLATVAPGVDIGENGFSWKYGVMIAVAAVVILLIITILAFVIKKYKDKATEVSNNPKSQLEMDKLRAVEQENDNADIVMDHVYEEIPSVTTNPELYARLNQTEEPSYISLASATEDYYVINDYEN